ncbi:MAG TPA: DNA primase [Candidatus Sulfotelmatobacter sp.]|nr:DNA primase [Candidatus Sulfotelmatobacter sp.]
MDDLSKIKEKIDIVSFISEYLPLKKMGRNFKANCPFHSENTPSFVISPERQIWHCFGCGKGGDIFTFLMEYENVEFTESLRTLAKKAGVELKESGFKKEEYSEKEKIYKINNQALKFYNFILTNHPAGKIALSYLLEKRKINKGIIETFQLGFSPNNSNALSDYLIKKKGYKGKDLNLAGVSFERGGRVFDFFRGRIIFPLFDHRGNVVGFSGRSLNDSDMPKYINTKETSVYHKGSMFFGLNGAKEEIKKKQEAIIVEGEFDAISLFMEGIKNVVAIKGTALTENQVNLLSRFTPKVILCLDQDSAGFEATKRSLEAIEKKGLTASIIVLKDAKDPDEAIKKDPVLFKKSVKEHIGVYDFLIDKILSENNKDSADGKKVITDTILPLLSNISNEIIKEHYLKKLSKEIDVSLDTLLKEVEKLKNKNLEDKIIIPSKDKRTRRELLEEYLLSLIIQSENLKKLLDETSKILKDYQFQTTSLDKILQGLYALSEKSEKVDIKNFSKNLSKELTSSFDICYLFPLPKFSSDLKYEEEVKKVSKELLGIQIREKIKLVSDEIKEKEYKKDEKSLDNLKKEFTKLLSQLPKN